MNWRNIQTVWARELRDQLRDRRTLFMVAVLPLLMYPLMGMSFFQLAQFMRSHTPTVLVVGAEQLEEVEGLPTLLNDERFAEDLDPSRRASRMKVVVEAGPHAEEPDAEAPATGLLHTARGRLTRGDLDAVVYFPSSFADELQRLRAALAAGDKEAARPSVGVSAPQPILLHNSTRDGSRLAFLEVDRLISAWRKRIIDQNLVESRVPSAALEPFGLLRQDVAQPEARAAGVWAKLLPFVVLMWALTGAFYPAVDLCAGEKERGTLETLLVSPASRDDIVWGKLLTVVTFSIATALLNLVGFTAMGRFIGQQMASAGPLSGAAGLGMPPIGALLWLVVALPPVAALFSALSFACAAFARSTKEGQYYFMPLFLATLPLMLIPMSPGVELNLGTSLAPVMGLVLLLRSLLEGDVLEAVRYAVPVTIVTFGCCLLAIRWAVAQFNQEAVLFRGDERFDLRLWLRSVYRRRGPTPTVAMAVGCFVMILLLQFVVRSALAANPPEAGDLNTAYLVGTTLLSQACVILPALLLAAFLTTDRRETLLLKRLPRGSVIAASIALAVAVHPVATQLLAWIEQLYPLSDEMTAQVFGLAKLIGDAGSVWLILGVFALLPAVCEELTFRGCVLSGLRSGGSDRWAVIISAVFFGAAHATILQQSLSATVLGLLIGYLALTSGSLLPGVVFHATHNSLLLLLSYYADPIEKWVDGAAWRAMLVRKAEGAVVGYHPGVVLVGAVAAVAIVWWIRRTARLAGSPPPATIDGEGRLPVGAALATNETTEG